MTAFKNDTYTFIKARGGIVSFFIKFFSILFAVFFLISCGSKKNAVVDRAQPQAKPQVKDVLKGKTSAQILERKYQQVQTKCTLLGKKIKNNQLVLQSKDEVTFELNFSNELNQAVVINPDKPYELIYDLKEQVKSDTDLSKSEKAELVANLESHKIFFKIDIKPISFGDFYSTLVNSETGKKTMYLMKYSPIHNYNYSFELQKPDGVRVVGANENIKIYEKVKTAATIYTEIVGDETYQFSTECFVDTQINQNDPLKEEFRSQWCEAQVPVNPIEQQASQSVINPIARCKPNG